MDWNDNSITYDHGTYRTWSWHDHDMIMTIVFLGSCHDHCTISVNVDTCCENIVASYPIILSNKDTHTCRLMNLLMVWRDRLWVTYCYKGRTYRETYFVKMGNNKVYRLTSVKRDFLLNFNLDNDASQIGKLDDIFCSFLCVQKNQPCVNGQWQCCTTFFKTIVTVPVAMCALLILSAMKAMNLSVGILWYMEPELLAWISSIWKKKWNEKKWGVIPNVVQLQPAERFAQLQVRQ